MTGFLTRQAMRVLHPGHGVRPRVPTRFEPNGYEAVQLVESTAERVHDHYGTAERSTSVEDPVYHGDHLDQDAAVAIRISNRSSSGQPSGPDEPPSPLEVEVSPARRPAAPPITAPPRARTRPPARPAGNPTGPASNRSDDLADPIGSAVLDSEPGSQSAPATPATRTPTTDPTARAQDLGVTPATPTPARPPGHLRSPDGPPEADSPGVVRRSVDTSPVPPASESAMGTPAVSGIPSGQQRGSGTATPRLNRQSSALDPGDSAFPVLPRTTSGARPEAARQRTPGQQTPGQQTVEQQTVEPSAGQPTAGQRAARQPGAADPRQQPAPAADDPSGPVLAGQAVLPRMTGPAPHISISASSTAAPGAVPRRSRRQSTTPTEPTVQVRIGTVEVTAAPPPAPIPRRPRARSQMARSQTMTLSDYLTKRRGGDRK